VLIVLESLYSAQFVLGGLYFSSWSCEEREIYIQSRLVGPRLYSVWNDRRKGECDFY